ncbi:MAG: DUF4837 family protein [Bacteroidales bacterium]|nr:DUF4837 family protein [Bacteroidales bacterium]
MKNIFLALFIISILAACEQNSERIIPSSTGAPGQILVVMPNHFWQQEPGKIVKETLTQDYEVLPQSEPLYDITHLPNEAYSKIMQRTRNILYIDISSKVKKPEVLIAYDKHSKPQLIISVRAKDDKDFIEIFNKQKEKILSSYKNAERNRLIKAYGNTLLNKTIKKQLEKGHNISLNIPKGYNLDVDSSDFVWISQETQYSSQGILIWDYLYTDTSEFHFENLIAKRDSITKIHVPGPADSSYMVTEDLISPQFIEFMKDGKYTTEIRGLWKIGGEAEGIFMGGPFINYSTVDRKRNRIVTVDGYIYGGKKKKRELVRQVEAILYSLKILE